MSAGELRADGATDTEVLPGLQRHCGLLCREGQSGAGVR